MRLVARLLWLKDFACIRKIELDLGLSLSPLLALARAVFEQSFWR